MIAFSAAAYAKTVTLLDGRTLTDPYVLGQRPDGVEVGHKDGVMFVKFKDMPEDIRKKFNYDPAKAEAYEKEMQAAKQRAKAREEKKKADAAARKAKFQKDMENWEYAKLEKEIDRTKNRIEVLKAEIPKLEQNYNKYLDKSAELAGKRVADNQSSNYSWDGYTIVTGTGGSVAENTKRKALNLLSDELADTKKTLDSYKSELESKQNDIVAMQKKFDAMKRKKTEN